MRSVLALLAVVSLPLLGCDPVECPPKEGSISCGYCALDRMVSTNPHAGRCTYCTTSCGADPCAPACDGTGGGTGGCDASWVKRCGQTSGGIQFIGQPWPQSCGACPQGTHAAGTDTVTAGGPYTQCVCDGF